MEKVKFNSRMFTAIGMAIAMCGLPVSGIMNHDLGFAPLSQERHMWMTIHNLLGIFFLFFGTWHILINRKALTFHLKRMLSAATCREGIMAAAIVTFVLAIGILHSFLPRY